MSENLVASSGGRLTWKWADGNAGVGSGSTQLRKGHRRMTAAVPGDGATFTVYGECIPYGPATDSGGTKLGVNA